MNRDACCEHGLNWHHESRGCGYHGFSDDRCPCLLTFSAALDRHDAVVAATAAETAWDEGYDLGFGEGSEWFDGNYTPNPYSAAAAHPDEESKP